MKRKEGASHSISEVVLDRRRIDGVIIGELVDLDGAGGARVDFPLNPAGAPVLARPTVALSASDAGRKVALLFEEGDPGRPILVGVIQDPLDQLLAAPRVLGEETAAERELVLDVERLLLNATRDIVLRCGEASITLKRDGKVLIRGTHVLSRSSGPNRVKGASVQIN